MLCVRRLEFIIQRQPTRYYCRGDQMEASPSGTLEDRPSKMPARLADGLGRGSDLETGYPASCAPTVPGWNGKLGPPRQPTGRWADFGCNVS